MKKFSWKNVFQVVLIGFIGYIMGILSMFYLVYDKL